MDCFQAPIVFPREEAWSAHTIGSNVTMKLNARRLEQVDRMYLKRFQLSGEPIGAPLIIVAVPKGMFPPGYIRYDKGARVYFGV